MRYLLAFCLSCAASGFVGGLFAGYLLGIFGLLKCRATGAASASSGVAS